MNSLIRSFLLCILLGFIVNPGFASPGPFAYVTELLANRVAVIDTSTNTVVTTIPVGSRPREVEITPDGKFAWVANDYSGSVSVIDIASNVVVNTIGGFSRPVGIAFTPDGRFAYVVNFGGGRVKVVDTSTNSIVATIETGNDSFGIAMLPSGTHAYVSNRGGDAANIANHSVWVIDTATNMVTAKIPVGLGPHWLVASEDSSLVYVGAEKDRALVGGLVSVIDTATNTVVEEVATGGRSIGVVLHPDELTLFATNVNDARNVSVIDTAIATEIATISDGVFMPNPLFLDITPDGQQLYVTNESPSMVSVVDVETSTVTGSITVPGSAFGIAITPAPTTYSCEGFSSPMDAGPVAVRKNRALPLKAKLFDQQGNLVTDADIEAPPVLQVTFVPSSGVAVDVSDQAVPVGLGTEGNQFEFSIDEWRYNLKTKNYSASGTYKLEIVSGDGYLVSPSCIGYFVVP